MKKYLPTAFAVLALSLVLGLGPVSGKISNPSGVSSTITSLGGLSGSSQTFATGTAATWSITSSGSTHTWNVPSFLNSLVAIKGSAGIYRTDGTNATTTTDFSHLGQGGSATPTGTWDLGGAASLEVPNGAAPTSTTQGQIGVDTTDDQFVWRGATTTDRVVNFRKAMGFSIDDPSTSDKSYDLITLPVDITISRIRCHTLGTGTAQNLEFNFRTAVNSATSSIEGAIVCAYTGGTDDGTFTDAAIARGEILHAQLNTASGTPASLTVTVEYAEDRK